SRVASRIGSVRAPLAASAFASSRIALSFANRSSRTDFVASRDFWSSARWASVTPSAFRKRSIRCAPRRARRPPNRPPTGLPAAGRGGRADALRPVPDVLGRARADAVAAVSAQGFLVAVYEVSGSPPDTVAAETPTAGTALPRGATVILDVRRADHDTAPAPN